MAKAHVLTRSLNPRAAEIGHRIYEKREQKGYTQAELAARIKVTPGAVAQYETGRSIPRNTRLDLIALELGVSVEFLLTGDDPDEKGRAQTKTELEALVAIRSLPSSEQETVIAMLRGLVAKRRKN